jgi:thiol-disulfide isomerase/thioredoxin
MKILRLLACGWLALGSATFAAAGGDIAGAVRVATASGDLPLAERQVQSYRHAVGVTPELLEAESWLARGELDARQYDRADSFAVETRKLAVEMLAKSGHANVPLRPLDIALGAAIEVHAQVLAARGARLDAAAFLNKELITYRQSSIAPRIQKNLNLLTLEGKPAPILDVSHWVGPKPQTLAALKGHPVLLFFWAHWCVDCKAEVPILARLMAEYGSKGLVLIGPTQHYGYAAGGDEGSPEQETRYIDQVRSQYYAALGGMPVPLAEANFARYGCSTTPTLVLLDRAGIVRMYHPGAMSYESLSEQIQRVMRSASLGTTTGRLAKRG